jgi:Mrp family chromosome partitioning ATPase
MTWIEPIGTRTIPGNFGPMRAFNAHGRIEGDCGDTMEVWLRMEGVKVLRASFTTDGGETSVACGSLAVHLSQGKSLGEMRALRPVDVLEAMGRPGSEEAHLCADLALRTLAKALGNYEKVLKAEDEHGHGRGSACGEGCAADGCEGCDQEGDGCGQARASTGGAGVGQVRRRILVMSGKGGVGKSTIAVNLAMGFAAEGLETGLLDADLHGPSVPKLLGLERETLQSDGPTLLPVELGPLKVMSMGFALKPDQATIWRGPMKASVLDQFVNQVQWGALDVLVVDCPPGTGDEHLAVHQHLGTVEGAVIVTTPQDVATLDARKAITFCRSCSIPVLGIVENMSGFVCPSCATSTPIFQAGGGARLARELGLTFLGTLPLDPSVGVGGEAGRPRLYAGGEGAAAQAFQPILQALLAGAGANV